MIHKGLVLVAVVSVAVLAVLAYDVLRSAAELLAAVEFDSDVPPRYF